MALVLLLWPFVCLVSGLVRCLPFVCTSVGVYEYALSFQAENTREGDERLGTEIEHRGKAKYLRRVRYQATVIGVNNGIIVYYRTNVQVDR